MKVLIRADASSVIGIGHVMRCLALAHELRAEGAEVVFACCDSPGHLIAHIGLQGFEVITIVTSALPHDWYSDALSLQMKMANGFDWLVVDHYDLDKSWEGAMRPFTKHIAIIDDLCNRPHDADLLLDQNMSANKASYAKWLPADCRLLIGPRYAMLRPEFKGDAIKIKPKIERILVNFGGADPTREIFKVMEALRGLDSLQIDFVAGVSNPAYFEIQQYAHAHIGWSIYQHVEAFAVMMRSADLFIGALGGTTWERMAIGLPSLCIGVADNQMHDVQLLIESGVMVLGESKNVTATDILLAVELLFNSPEKRTLMSQDALGLVDGRGLERLIGEMNHISYS